MKNYLEYENGRNRKHRVTYERLLKRALKPKGVLVGHHLTFEQLGNDPNEIPSADTMMFCHDLMSRAFPHEWRRIIEGLVQLPCDLREEMLKEVLDRYEAEEKAVA